MVTRVKIDGMSCVHCVSAVFTSLTPVEGITNVEVAIGSAEIEHDGRVTIDQLRDAIGVAGYRVVSGEEERRRLKVL